MPAYFDSGFTVREPAWHGLGVIFDDYPGREEAMKAAGHDFDIIEMPIFGTDPRTGDTFSAEGFKMLVRSDNDKVLNVARTSYTVVSNSVLWDIVDAIMGGENVKYETAGVLKGGQILWVLSKLDEPVTIKGDNSLIYPYIMVSTAHDSTRSLTASATSVRVVCWNTWNAASDESRHSGLEYKFAHTKNVMDRVEEAKIALKLTREQHSEFIDLANELARHSVSNEGVGEFIHRFIPDPPIGLESDRIKANIQENREKIRELIVFGETIADEHRNTSWGLFCAGCEYLDHLRKYRTNETYFKRTMYDSSKYKPRLAKLALAVAG